MLYKMYAETSVRDGFVIRDEGYYKTVWETFMRSNVHTPERSNVPTCEPLIAEVNNEPVAAIFVFYFAGRAYYVYGMSRDKHREKMPTYLLQWEAMKRAKANGCTVYDLWGAPEVFDESDSMWGVYRFKEGLGGKVVRTLGAWDFAPSPLWYKMYSEVIPRMLDVMRSRGKARTKQSLVEASMNEYFKIELSLHPSPYADRRIATSFGSTGRTSSTCQARRPNGTRLWWQQDSQVGISCCRSVGSGRKDC